MANKYGTIITAAGAEIIAASIVSGKALVISEAAAGDGGGSYYEPSITQAALINERWRGEIASAQLNPENPNMLDIKITIPDDVGGFVVRELGLFSENGDLIAVCNTPDTEKVAITGGVSGKLTMLMHIVVADASVVEFVIKPSMGTVTREEMNVAIADHDASDKAHPDLWNVINNFKIHASLEEINLVAGEETIETIAQALALSGKSELYYTTGEDNAKIYPGIYGLVHVSCIDENLVRFLWTDRDTGIDYTGVYCAANATKWVGWIKAYNTASYAPTPFDLGAVAKAGDRMIGELYAGTQTPGEYLVRNQKLSATEEYPEVNGEICWQVE